MSGDDCPRRGKLFGGCKFEGRYDQIPPQSLERGGTVKTRWDALCGLIVVTTGLWSRLTCVRIAGHRGLCSAHWDMIGK